MGQVTEPLRLFNVRIMENGCRVITEMRCIQSHFNGIKMCVTGNGISYFFNNFIQSYVVIIQVNRMIF